MTTADDARRKAAFLYYDVPKKEQPVFDDEMKKHYGRMSADRVAITMIGTAADDLFNNERYGTYELYDDSGNLRNKEHKHIPPGNYEQKVAIPRWILQKLLDAMTSDWVLLRVADDYPVCVIGMIGEDNVAAYIAPRIDEDLNS